MSRCHRNHEKRRLLQCRLVFDKVEHFEREHEGEHSVQAGKFLTTGEVQGSLRIMQCLEVEWSIALSFSQPACRA